MPIVRRSEREILKGRGRVDLKRLRSTTDKAIAKWIAEDPDTAPELPRGTRLRLIHNPPMPDVKGLRKKLGLTQAEFARHFGLSRRTIEQWEQGRAIPDRPARILLAVIARNPGAVERAVAGGGRRH
jgi:putative transcriptional regulator